MPAPDPAPSTPAHPPERILWSSRAAPVSIALTPLVFWITVAIAAMLGTTGHGWWERAGVSPVLWPLVAGALVVFAAARLVWEVLSWFAARYTLTDRRVLARTGVLTRVEVDIPLDKIQNIRVVRLLSDRLFGVGSVGIDSAGNPTTEVWWMRIDDAHAAAERIRAAMPSTPIPVHKPPAAAVTKPLVIGLTGSIGGGKSTAAEILRGMHCMVIDADADAKAALDRPDVRESLVAWWGPKILTSDGTVDRKAVASIVFEKPDERTRLERLVHPIVRRSRADLIARAAAEGREVVVADVPLLYEAGVDAECDVVIFIDAPREKRLARVASRGWDEAEMTRREAAQLPVADKKARADERIENAGTPADLARSLGETLTRLKTRPRR